MIAKRKKPSKAHPKMSRRSKVGFQGNPQLVHTTVVECVLSIMLSNDSGAHNVRDVTLISAQQCQNYC